MDILDLKLTDCTDWGNTSPTPFNQSDESLKVSRIELGPIAIVQHNTQLHATFDNSAFINQASDFELLSIANMTKASVLLSASDGHSMSILKRNTMKQLRHLDNLCELAREQQVDVRCYLLCAFSCPYEGKTSAHDLSELCARLIRFGCEDVILVDSQGSADKSDLTTMLNVLSPQLPKARTGFYFSANNPNSQTMLEAAVAHGINKFCITRNGGVLIGSDDQSSHTINDLLDY